MHRFIAVTTSIFILLLPITAFADGGAADDEVPTNTERAADYYQEASEAYSTGQFDRAAELLALAFEYDPDLIYRYNQVLAHLGQGDYEAGLSVLDDYEVAMKQDGRFDDVDELRQELEEALQDRQQRAVAEEAASEDSAEPETDDAEVEPPPTFHTDDTSNVIAWWLVGTGSAFFAVGTFYASGIPLRNHIDRIERSRTPEGEREVYDGITFERQDDLDTLRTFQILSVVLLASGAAAGGTGFFLLRRNRSSELSLQPAVDNHGVGALVRGRF